MNRFGLGAAEQKFLRSVNAKSTVGRIQDSSNLDRITAGQLLAALILTACGSSSNNGENPVKEWTKGTWLTPLLAALDEPERSAFETAYGERVAAVYPPRGDGKTLFPFRRMFLIATAV